jgi:hypothetical protein
MTKKQILEKTSLPTYPIQTIYIFTGSGNALLLFVYKDIAIKRWSSYHDLQPNAFIEEYRRGFPNDEIKVVSRKILEDVYRNMKVMKVLSK